MRHAASSAQAAALEARIHAEDVVVISVEVVAEHELELALLMPMRSLYGAAPDGMVEREGAAVARRLLGEHWLPLMVPEEAIVVGAEDLSRLEAIVAPWAVNVSDKLQDMLLAWVRGGGTLICSGPFGLCDQWGNCSGHLMREAFGELELTFDAKAGRWRGQGDGGLRRARLGEGWVVLGLEPLGLSESAAPLLDAVSEAIPVLPVSTDIEVDPGMEILLREAADGTRYLFCINLSPREMAEGIVSVRGRVGKVRELTVEGGPAAPAEVAQATADIRMSLGPGERLCFELRE